MFVCIRLCFGRLDWHGVRVQQDNNLARVATWKTSEDQCYHSGSVTLVQYTHNKSRLHFHIKAQRNRSIVEKEFDAQLAMLSPYPASS